MHAFTEYTWNFSRNYSPGTLSLPTLLLHHTEEHLEKPCSPRCKRSHTNNRADFKGGFFSLNHEELEIISHLLRGSCQGSHKHRAQCLGLAASTQATPKEAEAPCPWPCSP